MLERPFIGIRGLLVRSQTVRVGVETVETGCYGTLIRTRISLYQNVYSTFTRLGIVDRTTIELYIQASPIYNRILARLTSCFLNASILSFDRRVDAQIRYKIYGRYYRSVLADGRPRGSIRRELLSIRSSSLPLDSYTYYLIDMLYIYNISDVDAYYIYRYRPPTVLGEISDLDI